MYQFVQLLFTLWKKRKAKLLLYGLIESVHFVPCLSKVQKLCDVYCGQKCEKYFLTFYIIKLHESHLVSDLPVAKRKHPQPEGFVLHLVGLPGRCTLGDCKFKYENRHRTSSKLFVAIECHNDTKTNMCWIKPLKSVSWWYCCINCEVKYIEHLTEGYFQIEIVPTRWKSVPSGNRTQMS